MFIKALTMLTAVGLSLPASALIPQAAKLSAGDDQLNQVRLALESQAGVHLTAQQTTALESLSRDERREDVLLAGTQSPTKSIYCVAVGFNAVVGRLAAACVHFWSLKSYTLEMVGLGYGFQVMGSVLRMKVEFDPSRYDNNFDPIPGKYGVVSQGLTVGAGVTGYSGDSGNKKITGAGLNAGLGIDLSTISLILIE